MANPYAITPANPLQALMMGVQGYDSGRAGVAEQEKKAGLQDAMSALQSGGDLRSPLAKLIGVGAVKEAAVIADFAKNNAEGQGVFGTPIYGTNADGSAGIGTFNKQGQFKPIDTGGFKVTPGVKMLDTGTGYVPVDSKTGQPVQGGSYQPGQRTAPGQPQPQVGYIPKDNAGEARDKKIGSEQGEATANLTAMRAKMPGLRTVVDELGKVGDQATYTSAGQMVDYGRTQLGMDPRASAVARTKYIAMVDNQVLPLLRETFGAAFTQKEGESLKVTLGDPNKSPQEKRAVLDTFIAQKQRNIEALELQTNQQATGGQQVQTPKMGEVRDGYRFKGGNPADPSSWVQMK